MADQKLTDRTEITTVNNDDLFHVVQNNQSYKVKKENLLKEQFVKDTNVSGTYNIDWTKSTYKLVLTGAAVITESNLPTAGTSKEISIDITGDFALTLPTDWTTKKVGDYDGTVRNLLVVAYQEANDYWTQITQPE